MLLWTVWWDIKSLPMFALKSIVLKLLYYFYKIIFRLFSICPSLLWKDSSSPECYFYPIFFLMCCLCCDVSSPSYLTGRSEESGAGQVEVFRPEFPMMFLLASANGFLQSLHCYKATLFWRSVVTITTKICRRHCLFCVQNWVSLVTEC